MTTEPLSAEAAPPAPRAALLSGAVLGGWGAFSLACWWLVGAYVQDRRPWILGLVTCGGQIAAGALVACGGARGRRAALAYALLVSCGAFALQHLSEQKSPVYAFAIVWAAAWFFLLWGTAGRVRVAAAHVFLALCNLALAAGVWRQRELPPPKPPLVFEVMKVDEALDLTRDAPDLPPDATIESRAFLGYTDHFLRFASPPGTTLAAAVNAATAWAHTHLNPPRGARVAWQREEDQPGMVLRSFVVREPPIVTLPDVRDDQIGTDPETHWFSLFVSLTPEAGERLRVATGEQRGKRLAVLFDGIVQIAPLVQEEIRGGHVTITLGRHGTRAEAERLDAALRGELTEPP